MDALKLLVGLVVLASVTAPAAAGASAGGEPVAETTAPTETTLAAEQDATTDPETADEYLAAFRELSGTPAFEQYTEFETIRSLAVSKLQVVEFDDGTEREMETVLVLLQSFDESYRAAENGSIDESLATANLTGEQVESLREQGLTYAPLADLALSRFYEDQGDALLEAGSNTARTPETLQLLERASTAFRRAGASQKFSQVNLRVERLRSEYERDVARMDAAEERANDFLDACSSCDAAPATVTGEPFGTFERYQQAGGALSDVRDAERRAEENSLSERRSEFASLRSELSDVRATLAVASAALLVAYGLVVGLVATLVAHRLVVWRRTVDASNVGSIVVLTGGSDA